MVSRTDIQETIHATLADILDPELPCSIVDLGLVEGVEVDEHCNVEVTLLPTFTGCPALDMIASDVTSRVQDIDGVASCSVRWVFQPLWTTDRISEAGRASLKDHGVTVPGCGTPAGTSQSTTLRTSAIPCPWCGSRKMRLDSPFGPTRCRTIQYCEACKNTFEDMKKLDHEPG